MADTQTPGLQLPPPASADRASKPRFTVTMVVATVVTVGVLSVLVVALLAPSWPVRPGVLIPDSPWPYVAFVLLALVADIVYYPVRHGDGHEELTFFEIVVMGGVLVFAPRAVLFGAVVGLVLAELTLSRNITKALFNIGSVATATSALVAIYGMAGIEEPFGFRSVVTLLVGALVFVFTNLLALAWILTVAEDVPFGRFVREQALLSGFMAVAGVGVASSAVALYQAAPLLVPFTIIPAVALWYAYQAAAAHTESVERSRRMIELSTALATPLPLRELVPPAADALRRIFSADDIMLVLDGMTFSAPKPGDWVKARESGVQERDIVAQSEASVREMPAELVPSGWVAGQMLHLNFDAHSQGALAIGVSSLPGGVNKWLPWATGSWHVAETDKPVLATLAGALASAVRASQHLAALRDETAKLSAVVDHATDGIAVLDRYGEVSLWSPAMTTITGLSAQAAIAGNDEQGSDVLARLRTVAKASTGPTGEPVAIARPDLEPRELEVAVVALDDDAGMRVVTVRDVTQQRRVERMKSDFIATVSHELRTPITPIKGYAQLLKRRWDRMPEAKRTDVLATIEDRADHLSRLVDDLLLASRVSEVEHARMDVDLADVDLGSLVNEAVAAFPNLADRISVQGSTATVHVDRVRAIQCLSNLIGNAGKYSPAQSPIAVEFRPSSEGPWATVDVVDHGRGIPTEELEKVFERFYRVEDPMTMTTGGSGLGLFISRELARAMGGEITVSSTIGTGSVFTLRLPVAEGGSA